MFKKIAFAGVFVGAAAVATAIGCGSSGTTTGDKDFATNSDGGTSGDGGADLVFEIADHDDQAGDLGDLRQVVEVVREQRTLADLDQALLAA